MVVSSDKNGGMELLLERHRVHQLDLVEVRGVELHVGEIQRITDGPSLFRQPLLRVRDALVSVALSRLSHLLGSRGNLICAFVRRLHGLGCVDSFLVSFRE